MNEDLSLPLYQYIEAIYHWNEIVGNKNKFDKHLEISMLSTEYAEGVKALESGDITEQQDALADMFFVFVGSQYKQGVSIYDTYKTMINVIESNRSKFTIDEEGNQIALKDEGGKIMKPSTFFQPDMKHLEKYKK